MISFNVRGSTNRTEKALMTMSKIDMHSLLDSLAQEGVRALAAATPRDTGLTAESWGYRIKQTKRGTTITWTNIDRENGFPVAIMLQYGHGTGTGGYVQGIDYINPVIKPIFDKIADRVWRAVSSA